MDILLKQRKKENQNCFLYFHHPLLHNLFSKGLKSTKRDSLLKRSVNEGDFVGFLNNNQTTDEELLLVTFAF